MKNNKCFKAVLCLVLSFIFIFGNALFVKACDFSEVTRLPDLYIDSGVGDFPCLNEYVRLRGTIKYNCLYPLGDKIIVEIKDIQTESEDDNYFWEQSNFDYELVDEGKSAFVKLQGKLTKRDAAGGVELERYIEKTFIFTPPAKNA